MDSSLESIQFGNIAYSVLREMSEKYPNPILCV